MGSGFRVDLAWGIVLMALSTESAIFLTLDYTDYNAGVSPNNDGTDFGQFQFRFL